MIKLTQYFYQCELVIVLQYPMEKKKKAAKFNFPCCRSNFKVPYYSLSIN